MDQLILPSLNTSIIGMLAFLLAFYFVVFLRSNKHGSRKCSPPEAGGAWPIIGHLHLLGGSQLPHVTLGNLADKHGPIFTIKLGQHKAIILSKKDFVKECFTTHDLLILSRPESLFTDLMTYDLAMFGFSPYGPYWRGIRKLVSMELFSTRRPGIELLKKARVSELEMWSKELYMFWNAKSLSSEQAVVDMKEWFGNLTLNIILRMIAGKRYSSGAEGEEASRVQGVIREFAYFIGVFLPADYFPFLKHFDFGGAKKEMKRISAEIDKLVGEWLKEHRENRKVDSADHYFIDAMISILEEGNGKIDANNYEPDIIIKSTCISLIVGAADAPLAMLTWALTLVLNNPQILEKVQQELNHHVTKDRRVTDADIPNLVYLQAVVKETFRLYPAEPLGGPRKLCDDATIGGYHVSKGTRVIINMSKLHRDPDVWCDRDPTQFDPERFLSTHKDVDVKGHNFELIPFSAGRRICPGMHFAIQMLHLILANIFHAFDLQSPGGRKIELKESAGLINHIVGPLELVVTPRLPPNLY